MNKKISVFWLCMFTFLSVKTCNLSYFRLDSLTRYKSYWVVNTSICIGEGRTGTAQGGSGPTFDILFAIYGPGGSPINLVSYFPLTLTGHETGCLMNGINVGPIYGAPFNCQASLYFQYDPIGSGCPNGFTCVSNPVPCGSVITHCYEVRFTLDVLPDSIRAFGIEGAGDFVGGCYPNEDMVLKNFSSPRLWGDVHAGQKHNKVSVNWDCAAESDQHTFQVERRLSGQAEWTLIQTVAGKNADEQRAYYSIEDAPETEGEIYYRITRTDQNGNKSFSPEAGLHYVSPSPAVNFFPNPTEGNLQIRFPEELTGQAEVEFTEVSGKVVLRTQVSTRSTATVGLDQLQPGIYLVSVVSGDLNCREKIVVQ